MTEQEAREKEKALIAAVARKDHAAFRELYDMTYAKVHFFLKGMLSDPSMAEDVLVDTYTTVWLKASTFRGKSRGLTWIIGISRNLGYKALRKRRQHRSLDEVVDRLANGRQNNAERLSRKHLLARALKELPAKHREVLDLVFFHGMTYPEVAQVLKVPVNTVKSRVFYAKDRLLKALGRMGIEANDI